jgi:hypothetical protein
MDAKKLFATFAMLMLALGIAGFAYAHWEKIITINGTVDTGKLNLEIIDVSDSDDPTKPDPGKDKNVADTEIIIDPQDPQRAIVTITNAYPSYYVYIHVTIRNVGSIPAKLKEIKVNAPECIEVEGWDHIGEQLEPYPKQQYQSDYSGYIHVKQCAEQGATYTFTIEFIFWNWNEVP